MNKNVVISPKPATLFITPVVFLQYARDFYKAFSSYKPEKHYSPPSYYLLCRALELSFKAYLLIKGVDRKQLKKRSLGHDLEKILKKAKEFGIASIVQISDLEKEHIKRANNWYARNGFEYFELENILEGASTLPDLQVLTGLLEKLIEKLRPICLDASRNKKQS